MQRTVPLTFVAITVWICAFAGAQEAAAAAGHAPLPLDKKLIEYGWDVPFPDFIRDNIATMERRPFDGLIFKLRGGGKALEPIRWEPSQFNPDLEAVRAIRWGRFTDNFVIIWAASNQDWFDDAHWEIIASNLALMARVAKEAGCVGVCFDAEPYGQNPWSYQEAAHKDTRTFAEYEAVARKRGAEFVQAVERELPDPRLLTFFQLSYFNDLCRPMPDEERAAALSTRGYALLPAFLNGMLDAAGPRLQVIDGNENAYYYTDASQYLSVYHLITQRGLYMVDPALHEKYRAQVQVGQALYVDQYFGIRSQRVLGHAMTPEERAKWFEHNAYWAMYTTDQYVWCYSERMNWWTDTDVPPGAEEALRSARDKVAAGQPLGFDLAPIVAAATEREKASAADTVLQRQAAAPRIPAGVKPPTIDGRLRNDAFWRSVPALEPFVTLLSQDTQVKAQTSVQVAYDDTYLYVAFRCEEPRRDDLLSVGSERDDYIFNGDVVEVFIKPGEESSTYYHFAVNPAGVIWDGIHLDVLQTEYNPEWQYGTHIGRDYWSVEMAIPWKALNMHAPEPGTRIRANFCRDRHTDAEWTVWSQTLYHFLEPEHFGVLIFE